MNAVSAAALDHIVIAGPDLGTLVAWFAELTGVTAEPGGRHPIGTQNALVALTVDGRRGPQYIELIGPYDDAADAPLPTKFGISELTGPTVQTYAIRVPDIDEAVVSAREVGWETGPVGDLSRRTPAGDLLEWRLTRSEADPERYDLPFLIDWGKTPHPGETVGPSLELVGFVRLESSVERAESLRRELAAVGDGAVGVRVSGSPGFALTLRSESGALVELLPAAPSRQESPIPPKPPVANGW
ncbi:glyoxalase-like protein [Leucobacter komagatae]|uniref:Glyoxalase-like protein n=1 Tax=Leucobacter komagatae TaxID=55969 RepID=A0A542Y8H5_9MICO|nr:VOC family protein [Leucobacter komagatae]TQL44372.1 glyoxalase-like protein [Leucobacter komagatae]